MRAAAGRPKPERSICGVWLSQSSVPSAYGVTPIIFGAIAVFLRLGIRNGRRCAFRPSEHNIESGAIVVIAVPHNGPDLARVCNVLEWVRAQQYQVSSAACFHSAKLFLATEKLRSSTRRRAQCFHGRKSSSNRLLKFVVEAVAWKYKRIERIRTNEQTHARPLQLTG